MLRLSEIEFFSFEEIRRDGLFSTPSLRGLESKQVLICAFGRFNQNRFKTEPGIACVIADEKVAPFVPEKTGLVVTEQPMQRFIELHLELHQRGYYQTSNPTSISSSATIHESAWIDEVDVFVGNNSIIGPNCSIHRGTTICSNVTIGSNVVIGSQGFEFRDFKGEMINLPHVGGVTIHDGAEVQSNTAIAKAIFDDDTVIGEKSAIAQNCFVSHGSKIGKKTKIAPGVVICGAVTVGDNVWIGPNATISNALSIGDEAFVSIGATILRSVKQKQRAYGDNLRMQKLK